MFEIELVAAKEFKSGDRVFYANVCNIKEVKPHPVRDDETVLVLFYEDTPDNTFKFSFKSDQLLRKVIAP